MAYLTMMLSYSPSITHKQQQKKVSSKQRTKIINSETLTNFQSLLKQETWQSVYQTQDTKNMFNSFLNTFLHIFEATFTVNYRSTKEKKNYYITQGIRMTCKLKRSLCDLTKNSNDPKAKTHYTKYCRILKKVIKEAKKLIL
jgi:SHS2 domain-containing protein